MIYKVIATSLALIPFFCWFGWDNGIRTPKEVASIISLLVIVGVSLFGHSLKPFRNRWLLILGGWCFFTTLIGITTPVYLDKIILNLPPVLIAYKSLFYISLSIMAIVCLASISLDLKKISRVINWTVIILCLYGIIQLFGCDEFFRVADASTGWVSKSIWEGIKDQTGNLSHRVVATLGNPAILAVFLAICLPFSLYRLKQEGKFSLILLSIIILLTHSTTAFLCIITGSVIYFLFTNRKIAYIIIASSILIGAIFFYKLPTFLNPKGRVEVIKESWKVLYKKPLTGLGLGNWEHLIGGNPDIVKKLVNQNWKEAHNEYWQGFFEIGLIGLILFLLTLWSTFIRFLKNITPETITLASSVVIICLASMFYFPLRIGPLALYSVLIYGMFENKIGEEK